MRRRTRKQQSGKKSTGFLQSRWVKLFLIGIGGVLCLIFIALFMINSYIEGDDFRKESENKLNTITPHISASLTDNIQVNGSELVLPSFQLRSKDETQQLSLTELSVDVNRLALIDRLVHIEKLKIQTLDIALDLNSLPPLTLPERDKKESSGFLPNKWRVDFLTSLYTSTQLTIGKRVFDYKNYQLEAAPLSQDNSSWKVQLSGGHIYTPFFLLERSLVHSASLTIKPDSITLDKASLSLSPGEMTLQGLYKRKSKDWITRLHAKKAPIAKLLDNNWKKRITGELDANLSFRGKSSKLKLLSGSVALLDARAEALPILNDFRIRNSYPYRSLEFSRVSADIEYPYNSDKLGIYGAWLIRDIFIQADGKITVKGNLIIKENRGLSGTLHIGIPRQIHSKIPLFALLINSKIFGTQDRDGFCWAKVNISGTLDAPQEDLSARLKSILSKQLTETGKNITQIFGSAAQSILPINQPDQPANPQDEKEETTPKQPSIIEQGLEGSLDLVEDGLNSIF